MSLRIEKTFYSFLNNLIFYCTNFDPHTILHKFERTSGYDLVLKPVEQSSFLNIARTEQDNNKI